MCHSIPETLLDDSRVSSGGANQFGGAGVAPAEVQRLSRRIFSTTTLKVSFFSKLPDQRVRYTEVSRRDENDDCKEQRHEESMIRRIKLALAVLIQKERREGNRST